MLLAPKTLWAMVNLRGSVGGKYGAKTHLSAHRRRRILQAAQGLRTTRAGGDRGRPELEEEVGENGRGVETVAPGALLFSALSISRRGGGSGRSDGGGGRR